MLGKFLVILIGIGMVYLTGCGGMKYRSGRNMQIVYPNKGWKKPGVSAKETFDKEQECYEKIVNDKQYQAWMSEQRRMRPKKKPMDPYMTNVECMESYGFTWGKVTPEDIYYPPPPPRWGWAKEGVSRRDAGNISVDCLDEVKDKPGDRNENRRQCMREKGFKWEIVDPHPASLFSD